MSTLFDHLARVDDPPPSKAAAGLDHSGLCARALVALVRGGAATTDELLGRLEEPVPDRNVLARRMTTLVRRGLATDALPKRPGRKGVPVTVFAATARGREVARG